MFSVFLEVVLVLLPAFGLVGMVVGARLFCAAPRRRIVGEVVLVDGICSVVEATRPDTSTRNPYRAPPRPGYRVPLLRTRAEPPPLDRSVLGVVVTLLGVALVGFGAWYWSEPLHSPEPSSQGCQF